MITIYNVFESKAATRMLFFRIDDKHRYILKSFLSFLSLMPDVVQAVGEENENIKTVDIPIDINITNTLRKL